MQFALAAPTPNSSAALNTDHALKLRRSSESNSVSELQRSVLEYQSGSRDEALTAPTISVSHAALDGPDQLLARRGGTGIAVKLLKGGMGKSDVKLLSFGDSDVKAKSGLASFSDGAPDFVDLSAASLLRAKDRVIGAPGKGSPESPVTARQSPFGVLSSHRGIKESGVIKKITGKTAPWYAMKSDTFFEAQRRRQLGNLSEDEYFKALSEEVARLSQGLTQSEIDARLQLRRLQADQDPQSQANLQSGEFKAIQKMKRNHALALFKLSQQLSIIKSEQFSSHWMA